MMQKPEMIQQRPEIPGIIAETCNGKWWHLIGREEMELTDDS